MRKMYYREDRLEWWKTPGELICEIEVIKETPKMFIAAQNRTYKTRFDKGDKLLFTTREEAESSVLAGIKANAEKAAKTLADYESYLAANGGERGRG